MGVVLTLGHEDVPVQVSIRPLAMMLRRPNHMFGDPLVPVTSCDNDYEETNSNSWFELVDRIMSWGSWFSKFGSQ